MSKNKIIKSVSFNITNPTDEKILKAVKRRNFSGYVKKLLLKEILLQENEKQQKEPLPEKEKTAAEKMEEMKKQLANKSINRQTNTISDNNGSDKH